MYSVAVCVVHCIALDVQCCSVLCVCVFLDWLRCSLDEMGKRVDDLEKNIRDLMEQVDTKEDSAGTEPPARK